MFLRESLRYLNLPSCATVVQTNFTSTKSHIKIFPWLVPKNKYLPHQSQIIDVNFSDGVFFSNKIIFVFASYTRNIPSCPHVTIFSPSGEYFTPVTRPSCSCNFVTKSWVSTSHKQTWPSSVPDIKTFPSLKKISYRIKVFRIPGKLKYLLIKIDTTNFWIVIKCSNQIVLNFWWIITMIMKVFP